MGGGIAGFILLCMGAFLILYTGTSIPTAESALLKGVSSTVYFSDGKLLGTFTNNGTNHLCSRRRQIPTIMNKAMVAAEDRHFYSEGGVSLTGIIRAAKNNLFGGGTLQGASTITEQYVKNYYQSLSSVAGTQSLTYKINEVIVAIKIARVKSKSWILSQYLNTAPFGPTTYGVGAAALQYFNVNLTKPGQTLTLAQAAMLAAMPNNPAVLSPDPQNTIGYQMLVSRWQYVLNAMASNNAITQQAGERAVRELLAGQGGEGVREEHRHCAAWAEQRQHRLSLLPDEHGAAGADGQISPQPEQDRDVGPEDHHHV